MSRADISSAPSVERLQIRIVGVVQGIGFRPFVYRLANELELTGWVRNDSQGVTIEIEGPAAKLREFLARLPQDKPPASYIYALDHRFLTPESSTRFEISQSKSGNSTLAWVLPDLGTCPDCLREIFDPENRRFRYPFTNCTNCGPRFTIIEALPYDRPNTSMHGFTMCRNCREEYDDPLNRRFHAQPNACPACGPTLSFVTTADRLTGEAALLKAEKIIRDGKIVALKGIGGFQLLVDARNEEAVRRLRERKQRQNKPFAVMFPDRDTLRKSVKIPAFAESLLASSQAPIILLQRGEQRSVAIAGSVAPFSPYLGVFLPYTPLHHLLLRDLSFPVVATSGNLTDDPIQFADEDALNSLSPIADGFLIHDRPILRQADDSVVQVIGHPESKVQMLRRARGYAPLPLLAPKTMPPLLALGGHLNSTFAASRNQEIIVSQHLGELEGFESREVFKKTVSDFLSLYGVQPKAVVHDMHPDYFTTKLAPDFGLPCVAVQHHHAHLAACLLENQIEDSVLGLTWDGTGFGPDKTIWGGEFLAGNAVACERFASLVPFRLPGGEKAIKETWRTALSLLCEAFGDDFPRDLPLFRSIGPESIRTVCKIQNNPQFSPLTTSMGRLFDGISALLGLSYYNSHQAESAQLLEYAAWRCLSSPALLPVALLNQDVSRIDWRPLIRSLVEAFRTGTSVEQLAAGFHYAIVEAALSISERSEKETIVMTGGVFCNRFLTEQFLKRFKSRGQRAVIHSQLPPTDGSLSVGQLWIAANQLS